MGAEMPFRILGFDQVQVQVQVAPVTPTNLAPYHLAESHRLKTAYAKRDRTVPRKAVIVVDGSCDIVPPPATRRMQAEWFNEHKSLLGLCVQSMVFIHASALSRGAMTALFWLSPMPFQVVVRDSLATALEWAIGEVALIGGTVAPELLKDGVQAVERMRQQAARDALRVG